MVFVRHDAQMSRVRNTLGRGDLNPRVRRAERLVDEDFRVRAAADGNRAVGRIADGSPRDIRRGLRLGAVLADDGETLAVVEIERAGVDAVVDGEGVVDEARPTAVFVRHHVGAVGQLGDGRHARSGGVVGVGDVVDGGRPGEEVRGDLVDEFLPVGRVALVRVVDDDLALVHEDEGLPDGSETVIGEGFAAAGDVGDELPCVAFVCACVEVDLGVA